MEAEVKGALGVVYLQEVLRGGRLRWLYIGAATTRERPLACHAAAKQPPDPATGARNWPTGEGGRRLVPSDYRQMIDEKGGEAGREPLIFTVDTADGTEEGLAIILRNLLAKHGVTVAGGIDAIGSALGEVRDFRRLSRCSALNLCVHCERPGHLGADCPARDPERAVFDPCTRADLVTHVIKRDRDNATLRDAVRDRDAEIP